ncbi:MAG: MFS transporter [bacterium]
MANWTDHLENWISLRRDVLVLSGALFLFHMASQMTMRFVAEYLTVLGATSLVVGLYGTTKNILSAVYPYPGGILSDTIGTRRMLVAVGLLTVVGYGLWTLAPLLGSFSVMGIVFPAWGWIFVGLFLVMGWKGLGLSATFALVKDSVSGHRLARGFASTEMFSRLGYLLGPLVTTVVLSWYAEFLSGFQLLLALTILLCLGATIAQWIGYRESDLPDRDQTEDTWTLANLIAELRTLPAELKPLILSDIFVRFGNSMVYVFFVVVITRYHEIGWTIFGWTLPPASFFGLLLGIEMGVSLLMMVPFANLGDHFGQKPVVIGGFCVYATFPVLVIYAPPDPRVMVGLFAFSGLRFAAKPAHKALIVGPSRDHHGGTTSGIYYMVRNIVRMPAPAIGGMLYGISPVLSFTAATVVGTIGVVIFILAGYRYEPSTS